MGSKAIVNTQMDEIDSRINYYLQLLPKEIKSVSKMKMQSELRKLFDFIKCIDQELKRLKSQVYQVQHRGHIIAIHPKNQENKISQQKNLSQIALIEKQFLQKKEEEINTVYQHKHNTPNKFEHLLNIDFGKQSEEDKKQTKPQISQDYLFEEPKESQINIIKVNTNHENIRRLKRKAHYHKKNNTKTNFGVVNIGNSCYLNSAIQCLYQTQYLNEQLNNMIGISIKQSGQFTSLYMEMCKELKLRKIPYNPSSFKQLVQKNNPLFQGNRQHDAGEALNTILNIIDEETNNVVKRKIHRFHYKYNMSDESLFEQYVKKYKSLSYSLIDLSFSGFFKTSYLCNVCNQQKRLFEKFNMVYLPLKMKDIYLSKFSDCLIQFCSKQNLDWHCSYCVGDTSHTKSMHVYKANKTIIFCLKRFNEDNTKIKTPLEIPLQLDLNEYIAQTHQVSERKHILYAAIVHIGEHYSGHYVAYCHDYRVKCWAEYNDSSVNVVSEEELKKNIGNAYILFYRMQKLQEAQEQRLHE